MNGVEEMVSFCSSLANRLHPNPSYRRLTCTGTYIHKCFLVQLSRCNNGSSFTHDLSLIFEF